MNTTGNQVLTIGHSNHTLGFFIELLRRHRVTALADVRSAPYSRFNPEFNRGALADSLKGNGIDYVYLGDALGGRSDDPAATRTGASATTVSPRRRRSDTVSIASLTAQPITVSCSCARSGSRSIATGRSWSPGRLTSGVSRSPISSPMADWSPTARRWIVCSTASICVPTVISSV